MRLEPAEALVAHNLQLRVSVTTAAAALWAERLVTVRAWIAPSLERGPAAVPREQRLGAEVTVEAGVELLNTPEIRIGKHCNDALFVTDGIDIELGLRVPGGAQGRRRDADDPPARRRSGWVSATR